MIEAAPVAKHTRTTIGPASASDVLIVAVICTFGFFAYLYFQNAYIIYLSLGLLFHLTLKVKDLIFLLQLPLIEP